MDWLNFLPKLATMLVLTSGIWSLLPLMAKERQPVSSSLVISMTHPVLDWMTETIMKALLSFIVSLSSAEI